MATMQTQRMNVRHDSDNPRRITGYCDLVMIPALDQFPLFYQCISLQKLNRPVVLMGRKKWDQFKRLGKTTTHRMEFLFTIIIGPMKPANCQPGMRKKCR
jgi:hypothetical protein